MTAIVGLKYNENVYIGADSAGVTAHDLSLSTRADPKVFRLLAKAGPPPASPDVAAGLTYSDKRERKYAEFVIGYTTSFRMGQLLQYNFSPPLPNDGEDLMAYMVRDFIPAVRSCLQYGGFLRSHEGVDEGGEFLVGFRGNLFHVFSDFQVCRVIQEFYACGSGRDLALGSLHATSTATGVLTPKSRVAMALEAAEQFSAGVSGPHYIFEVGP